MDAMHVVVQHLDTRLYLSAKGEWVRFEHGPRIFTNPVHAISFCIERSVRAVRLVNNASQPGNEKYVYPFGQDPTIKLERKKLRTAVAESRRLKQQKRTLLAQIDLLYAEAKEQKKQIPFKRAQVGEAD